VGDGAITELKDLPELVGFGLEIAPVVRSNHKTGINRYFCF